jgi:Family of unknown function (DUF5678)
LSDFLDESALDEALHRQVQAERDLSRRLEEYIGKWVAVREHEVVESANTLEQLLHIIDPDDVDAVLEVTERTGAAAYY